MDKQLEQIFIMAVASVDNNKDFIISSLRLMDTDKQRIKVLKYLQKNENVTKTELKAKMALISVGKA